MSIKSTPLNNAVQIFFMGMKSRLAEKEAEGYTGWDGAYPRSKLLKEIKRDLRLIETGKATENHAFDIANRIFMINYNSAPSDFRPRSRAKQKSA